MKKLLPKRKPERKPSDEEFALRKSEYVLRGSVRTQVCLGHSVPGVEAWLVAFRRLETDVGVWALMPHL